MLDKRTKAPCPSKVTVPWGELHEKLIFKLLGGSGDGLHQTSISQTLYLELKNENQDSFTYTIAKLLYSCINWNKINGHGNLLFENNNIVLYLDLPNINTFYQDVLWKIPRYSNSLTNSVSILSYCIQAVWDWKLSESMNEEEKRQAEALKYTYITILKFMKTIGDLSQVIFAVSQKIILFTGDSACKAYSYLFIKEASDYMISSREEGVHIGGEGTIITSSYLRCCMTERAAKWAKEWAVFQDRQRQKALESGKMPEIVEADMADDDDDDGRKKNEKRKGRN